MWLQSQLKCLRFFHMFLSKNNNTNVSKLISSHECVGLSSLPALHSFGHLILNTFLAKRLCLYDCFELSFV